MDCELIKKEYEFKKQQLQEEINSFVEHAINYDELIDCYETKEDIDLAELEWNDAQDWRRFDNLQNLAWIYERIVANIDEMMNLGDDKKKLHNFKKNIETLISSTRKLKKESQAAIECEQHFLDEANSALDLLDKIRGK